MGLLASLTLCCLGLVPGQASDTDRERTVYVAVVHADNPVQDLAWEELRRIFLAQRQHWNDESRIELVLPKTTDDFLLQRIYEMDARELSRYWTELLYRNRISARPRQYATAALMLRTVARKRSAIAIVRLDDLQPDADPPVRVLKIDGKSHRDESYRLIARADESMDPSLLVAFARSRQDPVEPRSATDDHAPRSLEDRLRSLEEEVEFLSSEHEGEPGQDSSLGDSEPRLSLHGFGHFQFELEDSDSDRNDRFVLGGLDFFVNSTLAEDVSFLSEVVFEPNEDGESVLDVERVLLKYDVDDTWNVQVGRFHTTLGHWNEKYHHGEWLQTSIGRPTIFHFEDDDGLLPVHLVGLVVDGQAFFDLGRLDWTVELGNGRGPTPDPPQVTVDRNDQKALNLALGFEPSAVRGLRLGGNVYFDQVPRNTDGSEYPVHSGGRERIVGVYAAWAPQDWELVAEYLTVHHDLDPEKTRSNGWYVQAARRFGVFTPYLRFDGVHLDDQDTFFASVDDQTTWAGGVRWDFRRWAALKLQFEHRDVRPAAGGSTDEDRAILQCSFTF